MISRKLGPALLVALALLLLLGLSLVPMQPAAAAPPAAPTPVSVTRPAGEGFITFNPFSAQAVVTDTTSTCFDVGAYAVIDALYSIDQGSTNTLTLTSRWSIDGVTLASGANLTASVTADSTDIQQLQVFGRYFCVFADVANTNAVTVTVQAIAK